MQTRRRALQLAGTTLAGLAGCLSTFDGEDDADTTDGFTEVALSDVAVREAVTYYRWPQSTEIRAPEDAQFVVATAEGPDDVAPPGFVLEADAQEFAAGIDHPGRNRETELDGREGGSVTQSASPTGYLAFRVPSPLSVDEARIVREDGPATPLPDAAVSKLRRPTPEFELDTLSVPDSVRVPEPLEVSLSVRNVGDVDGRFLVGVRWPTATPEDDDETTVVEGSVAAGETETFSVSLETSLVVREPSTNPLQIDGNVSAERSVRVLGGSTPPPRI